MKSEGEPPLIDWITLFVVALLLLVVLSGMILYRIRQQQDEQFQPIQSYERSELVQPRIVYYPLESYAVMGSVTAYSKIETCPNGDCITASGQEAARHLIACPYWIELGSIVEIKDLGRFTCADRTSRWVQEKYGNTFDLWFGEDYESAKEFGRVYKQVKIYR